MEDTSEELSDKRSEDDTVSKESDDTSSIENPIALTKHPLKHDWVLWYLKNERNMKQWSECLKAVARVTTVEDFWALHKHIQQASTLALGSDYYFFKYGIRPEWEDEMNCKGGRWVIVIERQNSPKVLDTLWLNLLVAMLGEQFDSQNENICGATVNIRSKGDKICLWTRDAENKEGSLAIGKTMKEKLGYNQLIHYECHSDTEARQHSTVKAKYKI